MSNGWNSIEYNRRDREKNGPLRRAARKAAGPTYIGRPCKFGHSGLRYSTNQTCIECTRLQNAAREQKRLARMAPGVDPEYRAKRRAQKNETGRRWRASHKPEKRAEWATYQATKAKRTPVWANLEAIKLVYKVAKQRERLTGIKHHVDHFYPRNGKLVSGLHVPLNLRVLSETENLSKSSKLLDVM